MAGISSISVLSDGSADLFSLPKGDVSKNLYGKVDWQVLAASLGHKDVSSLDEHTE
jgi:hypothetical protein